MAMMNADHWRQAINEVLDDLEIDQNRPISFEQIFTALVRRRETEMIDEMEDLCTIGELTDVQSTLITLIRAQLNR